VLAFKALTEWLFPAERIVRLFEALVGLIRYGIYANSTHVEGLR
jgi:hypothetical protein